MMTFNLEIKFRFSNFFIILIPISCNVVGLYPVGICMENQLWGIIHKQN